MNCEELQTKLKLGVRVGGPGAEGLVPRPPRGSAREAPSVSRRRLRRVACPLCRAAPIPARYRPQRARRRRRGHCGCSAAEASDGTALPAVVWPPELHSPTHQRSAQVAGRRRLGRESCWRNRRETYWRRWPRRAAALAPTWRRRAG